LAFSGTPFDLRGHRRMGLLNKARAVRLAVTVELEIHLDKYRETRYWSGDRTDVILFATARRPSQMAKSTKKRTPKTILKLPDLEQSKSAVLNSLTSPSSRRSDHHALPNALATGIDVTQEIAAFRMMLRVAIDDGVLRLQLAVRREKLDPEMGIRRQRNGHGF